MDKLTPIFSMTTYTFTVGPKSFRIVAETLVQAFEAANCKIREDKMVHPSDNFAWYEGIHSNSFYLGAPMFLD